MDFYLVDWLALLCTCPMSNYLPIVHKTCMLQPRSIAVLLNRSSCWRFSAGRITKGWKSILDLTATLSRCCYCKLRAQKSTQSCISSWLEIPIREAQCSLASEHAVLSLKMKPIFGQYLRVLEALLRPGPLLRLFTLTCSCS